MNKYFHIVLVIWLCAVIPLVFAENFQNQPTLTELNETVEQAIVCGNAVIERDEVVNRNQNFFPYCGDWQSYFASLQTELEYLPTLYVNHVSGPLNAGKTGFLYFTLAAWRSAAGLNANGFRRATEQGGGFSYGQAQPGDVIGSWIYEDIDAGYSALKWTYWANRSVTAYERKASFGYSYGACISDWATKNWATNSNYQQYAAWAENTFYPNTMFWATRYRIKDTVSFPANCAARSMDVYMNASGDHSSSYFFYDFDDWGVEETEFFKYGEVAGFSGTTYTSGWIGDVDVCPVALCPEMWEAHIWPTWFASPYYLAKWNFTDQ